MARTGAVGSVALALACSGADTSSMDDMPSEESSVMAVPTDAVDLLRDGQAVFGIFSGDHTREQGAVMAQNLETDFVFFSLESGPFDIPSMRAYIDGLADGAGAEGVHPVALRIPPIGVDADGARARAAEGLDAGAAVMVFPHVENAEQAALAVSTLGADGWPSNPAGTKTNILLLEDQGAVEDARAIVGTAGVGVAIPGPGDLRRAYEGDMEAVESAIQTVLAACKEFEVPCGITAGTDDIADRLEQGFRLIIVNQPEALAVGRAASGRSG